MRTTAWITGVLAITAGLVMAGSRPCFAINTPDTGYKITSADQTIDVFSVCKQVKSSRSLFAPTKSSNEWNNFRNWAAGNTNTLTLSACPTCSDGIQNQGETGIDCGGPCPPCGGGTCGDHICNNGENCSSCPGDCGTCAACTQASDCNDNNPCTNDSCTGGTCQHVNNTAPCDDGNPATCNDVCSNGVCAGGSCGCSGGYTDCAGTCDCKTSPGDYQCVSGTCLPSCGVLEGTCCGSCASGYSNLGATWDCASCCSANNNIESCAVAPTCSDGIQNQGETGVDCGGPCPACGPACGDGTCDTGENCDNCPVDCGCPAFQYCNSGRIGDNLCYCDCTAVCQNTGYSSCCGSAGCGDADVSPWGGNWSAKCDGLTFGCMN